MKLIIFFTFGTKYFIILPDKSEISFTLMKKTLIVILAFLVSVSALPARVVTGSVKCGKEKMAGVVVTDGHSFATTGKNGRFKMDISDNADFVYVVTPSGYTADYSSGTPVFFIPAAGNDRFDFQLSRTSGDADYTIVAMADPQTLHMKHFSRFMKTGYPDLCATIGSYRNEGTVAGITLGDICWDSMDMYPAYKEKMSATGIPFYPVIGNHDHQKDLQGDHNTSGAYRESFGPENYAFGIGGDYVIVLDAIEYDTQKQYSEKYSENVLSWVSGLLGYIPEDAHIFIAQHAPFIYWERGYSYIGNGDRLLSLLQGRKVTFLSGHTHINNNMEIAPGISESNVAAICGSWWITDHCTDGTPAGYRVIEKRDGKFSSYYKSVGHDKDFQVEVFKPGESFIHPNGVVANVWDYDPSWKVEWFQDGKPMGPMRQVKDYSPYYIREIRAAYTDRGKEIPGYKMPRANIHYFLAEPDQYAGKVTVSVTAGDGRHWSFDVPMDSYVDVQAHRGGAGLMPENTFSSMKNALDLGVNTLEMDLQISADGQVVVSHDAYFHSRYATRPDGSPVLPGDPKEYIYTMPYDSVAMYDTGIRESTVWPEKACLPEHKPLADELIDFTENYAREHGMTMPRYNIEVKSKAGKAEGKDWPEYRYFVDRCMEVLLSKGLGDRLVVQCFDVRALNYMHEKYPQVVLSYLVGEKDKDFDTYMSKLDFIPQWLSPHHTNTDAELCRKVHEKGMKIVPWTADEPEEIRRLADLGVDAIISNYPDRALSVTRGYSTR